MFTPGKPVRPTRSPKHLHPFFQCGRDTSPSCCHQPAPVSLSIQFFKVSISEMNFYFGARSTSPYRPGKRWRRRQGHPQPPAQLDGVRKALSACRPSRHENQSALQRRSLRSSQDYRSCSPGYPDSWENCPFAADGPRR